jgi:hypothetical protein
MHDWEAMSAQITTLFNDRGDRGHTGDIGNISLNLRNHSVTPQASKVSPLNQQGVTPLAAGGDTKLTRIQALGLVSPVSPEKHDTLEFFQNLAKTTTHISGFWREASGGPPRQWCEGLRRLAAAEPVAGFSCNRWQQLIEDGRELLGDWGEQAARLGWTAEDLFGVHPTAPATRYDVVGLAPLLMGRQVSVMTVDRAIIATRSGSMLTYRRGQPGAVLLWDLVVPLAICACRKNPNRALFDNTPNGLTIAGFTLSMLCILLAHAIEAYRTH